jgi:hypothetical protein
VNNTTESFEEFFEMVGTNVSKEGWHLYFDKRGFVIAITSPIDSKGIWHHKGIRTYAQARDFLCSHNQPELIKGLYKISFRGNRRERIRSE